MYKAQEGELDKDILFGRNYFRKFVPDISSPKHTKDMASTNIFISYSHDDVEYKKKLDKAFAVKVRIGKVKLWSDKHIDVGDAWEKEILENHRKSGYCLVIA